MRLGRIGGGARHAACLCPWRISTAVLSARVVGAVYLLVGLLGFVAPDTFGLMPIGGNDIWLHLATAAVLLGASFMNEEPERRTA